MTAEQKAEAYDKVREKIAARFGTNVAQEIFSEYEESEDEKIKNEIKVILANTDFSQFALDYTFADMLTWLEKQGEQKPNPVLDIEIPFGAKDSELQEASYYIPEGFHAEIDGNKVVIKSDDKNSANKLEQKFKIGDWIFSSVLGTARIIGVNNDKYQLEYIDGKQEFSSIDYVNYIYVKWSIKIAKDGDIVCTEPTEGWLSPFIAIYKRGGIDTFDSYCIVDFDGNFDNGFDGHATENIHPATKEQRDMLFQKMHEAGYTFDFENKELKKIEDEPQLKEGKFYECIKPYYYLGGGQYWFDEGKVYFCEKDGYLRSDPNNLIYVYDCKNWQSCFRPYTEKDAWSKEDEETLDSILNDIKQNVIPDENDVQWLKSIKYKMEKN